jgi:undecaprenyl diphosphate synthase
MISVNSTPRHVAIIMDGNGRWAKRRFLPRTEGHRAGAKAVRRTLRAAVALGVAHLTLYTFSLENWDRPEGEVTELMRLLKAYLEGEEPTLKEEGISLDAVGMLERLPGDVASTLERIRTSTAGGTRLALHLCLSYGGRQEILEAAERTSADPAVDPADGESVARRFGVELRGAHLPPVDLLIRTSGEQRISNFLLWQLPGAYLHFTKVLWPDFNRKHLAAAIDAYRSCAGAGREGAGA